MTLVRTREAYEEEERERLAPFAICSASSAGRLVVEPPHPYRTDFQRDRDRVVHSRAFRRLEYKTQVFVHHEGDHHRNRLTHTLEGAQITRTIARALRLNEDLAEAIVLAHDLGHTPFGHAGERVLHALMAEDGGFEHNRQTLRVVDLLEERYPGFRGLNLTAETREGVLKHGVEWPHPLPLPKRLAQPSLEAQVADVADEVAYTNHDLDDGLRSGLLSLALLDRDDLWRETRAGVVARMPSASERVLRAQTVVALTNRLVTDVVDSTAERLERHDVRSVDDVRRGPEPLVGFSEPMRPRVRALKRLLFVHLYQHPHVREMNREAERVLGDLFAHYRREPRHLPANVVERFGEEGQARAIADYIAGMTDRFALAEHGKLVGSHGPG